MKNQIIQINRKIVPDRPLVIGFVNPPHIDWSLANILTLFLCQSHYSRHGKYSNHVTWLEAPYRWDSYKTSLEVYQEVQDADVIMFSSYFWNYNICDDIARIAKENNKITVLGGPHIGDFSDRPYDYVCKPTKPGEVFMEDFINDWFENQGKPSIDNISWEFRSNKSRDYKLDEVDYSVYEDHLDYMTKILNYAEQNKLEPYITIETARGCPYACSFCEWGGGIGGKVYKKPMEIVKRDILAMKKAGFISAMSSDANFGMYEERDIEILKFAWDNGFNITDISTLKSKDLSRRKRLVDAWFNVIGQKPTSDEAAANDMWNRTKHMSVVPTVSIQSVSDEAMKVANRVDLSLEDKIELSRYIGEKTEQFGYPVPALELILAMPGSTLDDFYAEMEIIWNFKCWGLRRHDYMFLPDSELSSKEYVEKYKIKTAEVYTDAYDEGGEGTLYDNLYVNNESYFNTIIECYSFTHEEFLEMAFMNTACSYLLKNLYADFSEYFTCAEFSKTCYTIIKQLDGFSEIHEYLMDLYNPDTEPKCIKKIHGVDRTEYTEQFLEENIFFIKNGLLYAAFN